MLIDKLICFLLVTSLFNIIGIYCVFNHNNVNKNNIQEAEEFALHSKQNLRKYKHFNSQYDEKKLIEEILNELSQAEGLENYLVKSKIPKGKIDRDEAGANVFFPDSKLDFEISSEKNGENSKKIIALSEGAKSHNTYTSNEDSPIQLKQNSPFKTDHSPVDIVKVNLNENTGSNDALPLKNEKRSTDFLFYSILFGCVIAGLIVVVATGFCLYAMHKSTKLSYDGDFPQSYGNARIQSKNMMKNGDKGLAHSAQMYHYQHQKQQMIAMEKANHDMKPDQSDNSEGETDEGDYTVYECPGLAHTGEMEVKNPLFKEEFGLSIVSNTNSTNETTNHDVTEEVLTETNQSKESVPVDNAAVSK